MPRIAYLAVGILTFAVSCWCASLPEPRLLYATPDDNRSHVILDAICDMDELDMLVASAEPESSDPAIYQSVWQVSIIRVKANAPAEELTLCKARFFSPFQFGGRLLRVGSKLAVVIRPEGRPWLTRVLDSDGKPIRDIVLGNAAQRAASISVTTLGGRVAVGYGRTIELVDIDAGTSESHRIGSTQDRFSIRSLVATRGGKAVFVGHAPPSSPNDNKGDIVVGYLGDDMKMGDVVHFAGLPISATAFGADGVATAYIAPGDGNPLHLAITQGRAEKPVDAFVVSWDNVAGKISTSEWAEEDAIAVLYPKGALGEMKGYSLELRDRNATVLLSHDVPVHHVASYTAMGAGSHRLWVVISTQGADPRSKFSGTVRVFESRALTDGN